MAAEQFGLAIYMVLTFVLGILVGAALITRRFQRHTLIFYTIGLLLVGLAIGQFFAFKRQTLLDNTSIFWALEIILLVVGGFCAVLSLIHMRVGYVR